MGIGSLVTIQNEHCSKDQVGAVFSGPSMGGGGVERGRHSVSSPSGGLASALRCMKYFVHSDILSAPKVKVYLEIQKCNK